MMTFWLGVRRKPKPPPALSGARDDEGDPLTYILRLAGVMTMIFGIVIAGMFTFFTLSNHG